MQVCIVSAFRNASSYISRYCEQMDELQKMLNGAGISLHLVLGYGDSKDGTGEILFEECSHRFCCSLVDVSHGGHHYGSIVHKERFRQLAYVGNLLWRSVPFDASVVGLIESDLIWQPYVALGLVLSVGPNQILAPLVLHQNGQYYDTWAYRRNGIKFQNDRPYHPDLGKERYLEMDSVGSFLFMQADLARQLSWPEEDVVVGLCNMAREKGAKVFANTEMVVYHP